MSPELNAPDPAARPALARGCRLQVRPGAEPLLLVPEGALKLAGPGRDILELCDGTRTVDEIVGQLQAQHPETPAARIAAEVGSFLARLRDRRAVDY